MGRGEKTSSINGQLLKLTKISKAMALQCREVVWLVIQYCGWQCVHWRQQPLRWMPQQSKLMSGTYTTKKKKETVRAYSTL